MESGELRPDFTSGFTAFLEIPTVLLTPISLIVKTSRPVGVSTHSDFDAGEEVVMASSESLDAKEADKTEVAGAAAVTVDELPRSKKRSANSAMAGPRVTWGILTLGVGGLFWYFRK
ncbi:uncharacterized protein DS421_2g49570 [Arachis hypogaea]|nr:uncharacterized protein DS421_2g49570 [Arachis hypogaea]